jgi:hypothetical protein
LLFKTLNSNKLFLLKLILHFAFAQSPLPVQLNFGAKIVRPLFSPTMKLLVVALTLAVFALGSLWNGNRVAFWRQIHQKALLR